MTVIQSKMPPEIAEAWTLKQWRPDLVTVHRSPLAPYADVGITPTDLFSLFSDAYSAPDATYHVSETGDDENDGQTKERSLRSIWMAHHRAVRAGAKSMKVFVYAPKKGHGFYPIEHGFTNGGAEPLEIDAAYIAVDGTIHTGAWSQAVSSNFIKTAYPAVYAYKSDIDANRIVDIQNVTPRGTPIELCRVDVEDHSEAISLVDASPGSWAHIDGHIYIHRADGQRPSERTTRIFLSGRENIKLTSRKSLFIGAETGLGSWEMQGGARGVVDTDYQNADRTERAVVLSRVSAKFAGRPGRNGNAYSINALNGLFAAFGCDADASSSDGFNAHRTKGGRLHFLTVNCSAFDNGRGVASSNGWTLHEDVVGVDLAGVYRGNAGGTIGNIARSKCWIVGSIVGDDRGDIQWGSSAAPSAIKMGGNAVAYLDSVIIDMPSSKFGIRCMDNTRIYIKNMLPRRQEDVGEITQYSE